MKASALVAVLTFTLLPTPSPAQTPASTQQIASETAAVGTVVSSRPTTLVIRTEDGRYVLFVIDRKTVRPRSITEGTRVTIESTAGDETPDGARLATSVTVSGTQGGTPVAGTPDAIPPNIRQLERDIARNVRRYRAGFRAGVGLDPELISVGAHATFGPLFDRRLLFRPNVEFAYGELTTVFAVNLEAIYRLTQTMPRNQWSPYAGGGPSLGFSHRGFSTETTDGRSFDFHDLNFNGGLNLLAGVEKPSGVFVELKATVYADPHLRLLFGITF